MLHVAVATRAFRRYSTYRAATLAGIFTNSVFGVIYSYAYLALWDQRPHAGGYNASDAVTYVWLGQALLMTVALWGGGSTDDLADRIRSGDIAIDLYRPVGLLGWYLAADLGRAAYHLLTRGLGPTLIGALLFDLVWPEGPVSGMVLPLVLFPRLAARRRARPAVGVVPADPCRHLAGASRRLVDPRCPRCAGAVGSRPADGVPGSPAGRDPQAGGPGWLTWRVPSVTTRRSRRCGCAPPSPIPCRSGR